MASPPPPPATLTTLLARLAASGAEFVLVGGLAAVAPKGRYALAILQDTLGRRGG